MSSVNAVATQRFSASSERVYAMWLTPEHIGAWFGPGLGPMTRVDIDARVGGCFYFVQRRGETDAAHAGEYLELVPAERIAFTWRVPPDAAEASKVFVDITPLGSGCEVTVTHEMGAQWAEFVPRGAESWRRMLEAMSNALAA